MLQLLYKALDYQVNGLSGGRILPKNATLLTAIKMLNKALIYRLPQQDLRASMNFLSRFPRSWEILEFNNK